MRPIRFTEILREKCHMCGCENKVHSDIIDKHKKIVGYSLKCCNCGKYTEFLDDREMNGIGHRTYNIGEQTCLRPTGCPYKDCRLYNKRYIPEKHKPKPIKPLPYPDCNYNKNSTITYIEHESRFL